MKSIKLIEIGRFRIEVTHLWKDEWKLWYEFKNFFILPTIYLGGYGCFKNSKSRSFLIMIPWLWFSLRFLIEYKRKEEDK